MPLPPALAAKLAKRGLVAQHPEKRERETKEAKVASCCPNKYNIYHDCTTWCQVHWKVQSSPEPRYLKNIRKLLEKYPLPKNCTEQFDTGIGRYYYWNMEKNLVSWLPPTHPKAVLTESASKLRSRLKEEEAFDKESRERNRDRERRDDINRDRIKDRSRDDDRRSKHDDRSEGKKKRFKLSEKLDPMDPAAYSDIPRGSWSDGLESNKSKADSTASGALFQQRPYPSPGDILEANKSKGSKNSNKYD